jgi:hypothetical protein
MEDNTEIKSSTEKTDVIEKIDDPKKSESHFFGLSVRGLITLSLVWTVCGLAVFEKTVEEPLYTLVGMVAAYYFGQNSKTTKLEKPTT